MRRVLLCIGLLTLMAFCAFAQSTSVPNLLNFQGRLAKPDGTPVPDGNVSLTFRIFGQATGGTARWSQTVNPITVRNGVFACLLTVTNPETTLEGEGVYLELQVNGDSPLVPRQRIVSVAYALKAATVPDGSITSTKLADASITTVKLADGAVTTSKIADSAVTTSKISDGAVTSSKLAVGLTAGVPSGYSILGASQIPPSGYTYTGESVSTAAINSWTEKAPSPTLTQASGQNAALLNGKVYLLDGSKLYEYDPALDTWTAKANRTSAVLGPALVAANGKLYALGGGGDSNPLTTNEEYAPATNTWATKAPMPTRRWALSAATVDGKVYAIGGFDNGFVGVNEMYDPTTNAWTSRTPLPFARGAMSEAVAGGDIYLVGGWNGGHLNTTLVYDSDANTYANETPMPTPRHGVTATLIGTKIYVMGGLAGGGFGSPIATNEAYDVVTKTWTTGQSAPTARSYPSSAGFGGKAYLFSGNNSAPVNQTHAYAPPNTYYIHTKN